MVLKVFSKEIFPGFSIYKNLVRSVIYSWWWNGEEFSDLFTTSQTDLRDKPSSSIGIDVMLKLLMAHFYQQKIWDLIVKLT